MNKWIRWTQWGTNGLIDAGQMPLSKIPETLRMFELEAHEVLKSTGADHVIYGWKKYGTDSELEEISFYMLPMDDNEFCLRIQKLHGQVYALHKL